MIIIIQFPVHFDFNKERLCCGKSNEYLKAYYAIISCKKLIQ